MAQQIRISIVDTAKGTAVETTLEQGQSLGEVVGKTADFFNKNFNVAANGRPVGQDYRPQNNDVIGRTPNNVAGA